MQSASLWRETAQILLRSPLLHFVYTKPSERSQTDRTSERQECLHTSSASVSVISYYGIETTKELN